MVGEIRDGETAQVAIEASPHGPPGDEHAAHQQRARDRDAPARHGHGPLQLRPTPCWACWRSAWCAGCASTATTTRPATSEEEEELLHDYLHAFGPMEPRPLAEDVLADWRQRFGQGGKLMHCQAAGCEKCGGTGFRGRASAARTDDREPAAGAA